MYIKSTFSKFKTLYSLYSSYSSQYFATEIILNNAQIPYITLNKVMTWQI